MQTPHLNFKLAVVILCCIVISACGFQLRGYTNISYKSMLLQGAGLSISRELKQAIKNNNIALVDKLEQAELVVELINESNEKRILSIGGTGVVREYELHYQANFRTREANNPIWDKVQTVRVQRDFSYDDKLALGKGEEETRLNADMRSDAVREIMRRLSAIKTTPK